MLRTTNRQEPAMRTMLTAWRWISGLWTAYWAVFIAWQWISSKTRGTANRSNRSSDIR